MTEVKGKNKGIIATIAGLVTLIFVCDYLKRRKSMNENAKVKVNVDESKIEEVKKARTEIDIPKIGSDKATKISSVELSPQEKRELTNRFGGMSRAEMEFILSLIPVELCLGRIADELDRAKAFEDHIKMAISTCK